MKGKILCFGELLLRLSPAVAEKSAFTTFIGGAEANTATALSKWQVPVSYCTALPDNFASQEIIQYLEGLGIQTSAIRLAGERLGIYYLAQGADLKSSVVYDRQESSFSDLKRGMLDWDEILKDISWLNLSAISPAINEDVADVCLEALEAASRKNIFISIDLNYRARLWKYGKEPGEVMPELVKYCDLVMGNIWAAQQMLGISFESPADDADREVYLDLARKSSEELIKRYPKCKHVAYTFRFDQNPQQVKYYSSYYTAGHQYPSMEFQTSSIADRSGSGDCFMAGLIYGLYMGHTPQDLVNFASAAAFSKLHEKGDSTKNDVLAIREFLSRQENKG